MSVLNITIIEINDAIRETETSLTSPPKPKGERKKLLELRVKKLIRVKDMRIEFLANIAMSAQGD